MISINIILSHSVQTVFSRRLISPAAIKWGLAVRHFARRSQILQLGDESFISPEITIEARRRNFAEIIFLIDQFLVDLICLRRKSDFIYDAFFVKDGNISTST